MDKTLEGIADFMHDQWSHWMKYLFTKTIYEDYGERTGEIIPTELAERWQRQMETPYAELSETEKDSDRKLAKKLIDKFMLCSYCKKDEKMDICNNCRTDSNVWSDY